MAVEKDGAMNPRAAASAARSDWRDSALEALRRAEFARALELLDGAERGAPEAFGPEDGLLRARILLKRDPGAALEDLARQAPGRHTPATRAEAAMLAGAAYARLGDARAADARFHVAESFAVDGLSSELSYHRALALWIERRLDESEQLLDRAELRASGTLLVECRVLRGTVAASRGNVRLQAAILLDTVPLVATPRPSVLHHAVVASQIAYLAREIASDELRERAYVELSRVAWTPDIADFRYTALRAVAWCHALQGDYFNAFRKLKEASGLAPSDAWRVMSSCDRAYLASVLGETRWAEQELRDAHELAGNVAWSLYDGEERFALSLLAELFAPRDPALALSYEAKYRATGKRYSRMLASSDDRRVDAMEAYSFGIVQRHLGARDEALRLFTQAWDVYDAIGYDWRAGRTALALADLSVNELWRARAAAKLRPYADSWLAPGAHVPALVVAGGTHDGDVRLTPAQRAIYEKLVRGLAIRAIAQELGRTENTVRNHVKAIFRACGVNSRAALMARAARR